jgi:hypothetical protein
MRVHSHLDCKDFQMMRKLGFGCSLAADKLSLIQSTSVIIGIYGKHPGIKNPT